MVVNCLKFESAQTSSCSGTGLLDLGSLEVQTRAIPFMGDAKASAAIYGPKFLQTKPSPSELDTTSFSTFD